MTGTPPDPMPSREETMEDLQRLTALRPPTDPATGMMQYDTEQAHEYREALQDIVDRYGSIESFQDAMRDSGAGQGPRLAEAAPPAAPNVMAAPPAASSLAQFARNMMAPPAPMNPIAQGPQGAPGGTVPRMPEPMQPGGPLPAAPGVPQNAGLPAVIPRRGTGTVQ